MVVLFTTLKLEAATPPKLTLVALVKFVPVMVTVFPVAAVCGVKEVMVGGHGVTIFAMKLPNANGPVPTVIVADKLFVAVFITLTALPLALP